MINPGGDLTRDPSGPIPNRERALALPSQAGKLIDGPDDQIRRRGVQVLVDHQDRERMMIFARRIRTVQHDGAFALLQGPAAVAPQAEPPDHAGPRTGGLAGPSIGPICTPHQGQRRTMKL